MKAVVFTPIANSLSSHIMHLELWDSGKCTKKKTNVNLQTVSG
jgi:hypothetical protein